MSFDSVSVVRLLAAILAGVAISVEDVRHRRIPNTSCGVLFSAGLVLAALQLGPSGVGMALLGAVAGFALFLIPYAAKGMGAGDVKLMAACGCLVGISDLITLSVLTALTGALLAAAVLLYGWLTRSPQRSIPYAPAIMVSATLILIARLRH